RPQSWRQGRGERTAARSARREGGRHNRSDGCTSRSEGATVMKLSHFFINRPIFAIVLSLLIVVGGGIALLALPISEYPGVVPPTVVVRGVYLGANPKVRAETVAAPLEHQINGVEGLLYMYSQSTSD